VRDFSRSVRLGICVAFCLAFAAQQVSAAQQEVVVTLRLINARSGKPLRHVSVSMSLWQRKPPSSSGSSRNSTAGVTNRKGEVQLPTQPLCQSSQETISLRLSAPFGRSQRRESLNGVSLEVSPLAAETTESTSLKLTADVDGEITLPASLACKSGGAAVKLRLAEEPSGKPLRRIYVYAHAGAANTDHETNLTQPAEMLPPVGSTLPETDAKGIVTFNLPKELLSSYVSFGPFSPPNLWGCSASTFPLDTILRTGIVAGYDAKHCRRLKARAVTPIPGEVVIYDRVFSRWDWFLQELP